MNKSSIKNIVKSAIFENIKESKLTLEGINISVQGYNYSDDVVDISSLCWWISKKVLLPILNKMTEEEKKTITTDLFQPDGNDYDRSNGIMNVYIGIIPQRWQASVLGGVQYFLDERGIEYGPWKEDVSKVYHLNKPVKTIRIPIIDLYPSEDPAPSMHVTYSTIMEVLSAIGMENTFNDYQFNASAEEIIKRVKKLQTSSMQTTGTADIFANQLKDMAEWALKHGYKTLSGG